MHERSRQFAELLWEANVVTFGDFVAKSGRRTPYFVNAGNFRRGQQLAQLGTFYADTIAERFGNQVDIVFGPAYKGIPLAVTTGIALASGHGHDVGVAFNRKEVKDHGEGGNIIGCVPGPHDRVVIVEDVTTAGTSIRETMPLLTANTDVNVVGLVVGVDRQERGQRSDRTALDEIGDEFGIETVAIATISEVVEHLGSDRIGENNVVRLRAYLEEYGPSGP
ncbi:MAG: orotate phosphoribosyltransferase [Nitriliruptoraceae bacterium]